jgi:hypothetical protein
VSYLLLGLGGAFQTGQLQLERLHLVPSLFELGTQSIQLVVPLDLLVRVLPPFRPQLFPKRLQARSNGFLDPLTDNVDGGQVG